MKGLGSAGQGGTLGNVDVDNGFCSSEMIACYSVRRGRKAVFGCSSYYLAYVISF